MFSDYIYNNLYAYGIALQKYFTHEPLFPYIFNGDDGEKGNLDGACVQSVVRCKIDPIVVFAIGNSKYRKSSKAFDVVNHIILLDKLYENGLHPSLWTIVNDMYSGLTTRVKWLNELNDSFPIKQGVRQGGILSPFLYKTYINPCLVELKQHKLGLCIGNIYCGCPKCADDLAMLSDCENELQLMANVIKRHSKQDRVTIHLDKSNAVLIHQNKFIDKKSFSLELGIKKYTTVIINYSPWNPMFRNT